MSISKGKKDELKEKFAQGSNDTGSPEVQVAVLSERISSLTEHLADHKGDQSSKRGLVQMVMRRRKLLSYLKSEDIKRYQDLIKTLGLRR